MNKRAFTLIELLVVVLIVGILAAIALPMYKVAVEKSHATEAYTMIKAMSESAERYALATGGTYPGVDEWSKLDIDVPGTGNDGQHKIGKNWTWWLSYSDRIALANRNPSGQKYYLEYYYIHHPSSGANAGRTRCVVYGTGADADFYKRVCESLCGKEATGGNPLCWID